MDGWIRTSIPASQKPSRSAAVPIPSAETRILLPSSADGGENSRNKLNDVVEIVNNNYVPWSINISTTVPLFVGIPVVPAVPVAVLLLLPFYYFPINAERSIVDESFYQISMRIR